MENWRSLTSRAGPHRRGTPQNRRGAAEGHSAWATGTRRPPTHDDHLSSACDAVFRLASSEPEPDHLPKRGLSALQSE